MIKLIDILLEQPQPLKASQQKIVDDILGTLNEGKLNSILSKMKGYSSKGLLTLGIIASLAQNLQAKDIPQNDIQSITQQGIEMVSNTNPIDKSSEDLLKKHLGKKGLKDIKTQANQSDTFVVAVKGTNRNAIKSQATSQAQAQIKGFGNIKVQDSKTYQTSDGGYLYILFYSISN